MKAINSSLQLDDISTPAPLPGQVLVKVICYGITADDVSAFNASASSSILGIEFSGLVVKVHPSDETQLRVHDRVLGFTAGGGSMAEYVVCDVHTIAVIPPGISFVEAAAIPDMWFSALQIVKQDADIQKRAFIAVFNAMSSRGQAVVTLAQLIGCRRIHCVVDSEVANNMAGQHLKLLGALEDELVIHNSKQNYLAEIARYDPNGLDTVIYTDSFPSQIYPEMSRPGGHIAIAPKCYQNPYGLETNKSLLTLKQYELFTLKGLKLVGCNIRRRNPQELQTHRDFIVTHILPKIRNKQVKVTVDKIFNWRDTLLAIRWVKDHPEALGKTICIVDNTAI